MLTPEESQQLENILSRIQQDTKIFDINDLHPLLLKLIEAEHTQLQAVLLSLTKLQQIDFSLADVNDEYLSAYLFVINQVITTQTLTLNLEGNASQNSIEKILLIISTIENPRIDLLVLNNFQLGQQPIAELMKLMQTLSVSDFQSIYFYENQLYLLGEDIVNLLETLLRNSKIGNIRILGNNISSLSIEVLTKLHALQTYDGSPIVFWPQDDDQDIIKEEFKAHPLDDDKKINLAKLILLQACKLLWNYHLSEPIPYVLTGTQYFEVLSYVIDHLPDENNVTHFDSWIKNKDLGLTEVEKLNLCNKLMTLYPEANRYIDTFNLNFAAGIKLNNEAALAYVAYLNKEAERNDDNRNSFVNIKQFTLTKAFIDGITTVINKDPYITWIQFSLANTSLDIVQYLGNRFATINNDRITLMSFEICDIKLTNDLDFKMLAVFLDGFPKKYPAKLELHHSNIAFLSAEQLETLTNFNWFEKLFLENNHIEELGSQLVPFLKKLPVNYIELDDNALYLLDDQILDNLITTFKNDDKDVVYRFPCFSNMKDLSSEQQFKYVRRTVQFEMLTSSTQSPIFRHILPTAEIYKLLQEFIQETPKHNIKVSSWIHYHQQVINLSYEQRHSLATQLVETTHLKNEINLTGFQLSAIDTLKLDLMFYQRKTHNVTKNEIINNLTVTLNQYSLVSGKKL